MGNLLDSQSHFLINPYICTQKFKAMELSKSLTIFKWTSILEGTSFLLLLFIAMPLKYIWHWPQMVEVVGMAHGVLFVAYIFGAFLLYKPMQWSLKTLFIICISSVLPFGPFYVEKKYL